MATVKPRDPIGQILVERGVLTPAQIADALAEQARTGVRLGESLVERGLISRQDLGAALARQRGVEFYDFAVNPHDSQIAGMLPEWAARRYRMLPVARSEDRIILAMADPSNLEASDTAQMILDAPVLPMYALDTDLEAAIERLHGPLTQARLDGAAQPERKGLLVLESGMPADGALLGESVLNAILREVARLGPTDVHFAPQRRGVRIRFRLDGVLTDVATVPHDTAQAVVSRLKVLAGMDLAEHVRPQDGRLTAHVMGAELDLRVATVGVHHGERAAVRILNPHRLLLGLERLGLLPEHENSLKEAIATPQGLVLLTGPAGSGKTTTLYALIRELSTPERSIITVEDPVEYEFDDITQIPVREKARLGFAAILRAVLRHDPNVIVIGEIRDRETAELAAQAALTGHLVLATLHASGIEEATARLTEMGVPLWLVRTATIAAVSQRLVRTLCLCRRRTVWLAGLPAPSGCADCLHTGYRGRTGVFRVVQSADGSKVAVTPQDLDLRVNARIMWESARSLIGAGVTDEAEVTRALGPDPDGLPLPCRQAGAQAGRKDLLAM